LCFRAGLGLSLPTQMPSADAFRNRLQNYIARRAFKQAFGYGVS
jgi:hypothetical protein